MGVYRDFLFLFVLLPADIRWAFNSVFVSPSLTYLEPGLESKLAISVSISFSSTLRSFCLPFSFMGVVSWIQILVCLRIISLRWPVYASSYGKITCVAQSLLLPRECNVGVKTWFRPPGQASTKKVSRLTLMSESRPEQYE
jgi:hypothetical protein